MVQEEVDEDVSLYGMFFLSFYWSWLDLFSFSFPRIYNLFKFKVQVVFMCGYFFSSTFQENLFSYALS